MIISKWSIPSIQDALSYAITAVFRSLLGIFYKYNIYLEIPMIYKYI